MPNVKEELSPTTATTEATAPVSSEEVSGPVPITQTSNGGVAIKQEAEAWQDADTDDEGGATVKREEHGHREGTAGAGGAGEEEDAEGPPPCRPTVRTPHSYVKREPPRNAEGQVVHQHWWVYAATETAKLKAEEKLVKAQEELKTVKETSAEELARVREELNAAKTAMQEATEARAAVAHSRPNWDKILPEARETVNGSRIQEVQKSHGL